MSDAAAFLRAIIAEPDDDLPRLQCADWLDERGDPRGEFIRVQCAITHTNPAELIYHVRKGQLVDDGRGGQAVALEDVTEPKIDALRRRERELLTANYRAWWPHGFEPTRGHSFNWRKSPTVRLITGDGDWARCSFTRGFVSSVTLSWADWQAHAKQLLEAAPIRRVNRPRACGQCRGGRWLNAGQDEWQWCPACRGTGTMDDWRGGGRVVLTTMPDWGHVEENGVAVGCQLVGRRAIPMPADVTRVNERGIRFCITRDIVPRLLAAEWPGVDFGLPAAQRWYDADEVAAMISRAEGDEALTGGRP